MQKIYIIYTFDCSSDITDSHRNIKDLTEFLNFLCNMEKKFLAIHTFDCQRMHSLQF